MSDVGLSFGLPLPDYHLFYLKTISAREDNSSLVVLNENPEIRVHDKEN